MDPIDVLELARRQRFLNFAFATYYVLAIISGQLQGDERVYGQALMALAWLLIAVVTFRYCRLTFSVFPTVIMTLFSTQLMLNLFVLGIAAWRTTTIFRAMGSDANWYNSKIDLGEKKQNTEISGEDT